MEDMSSGGTAPCPVASSVLRSESECYPSPPLVWRGSFGAAPLCLNPQPDQSRPALLTSTIEIVTCMEEVSDESAGPPEENLSPEKW
jgi:hypothetical protein